MNNEIFSKQESSLDQKWYDQYHKNGSFEVYDNLVGNKEQRLLQKEKFLNHEIDYPTLDYPRLDHFDFDKKEHELLQLKESIKNQEQHDVVKKVYQWKINEKIAELRMLRATKDGDDRRFARYSRFVYGAPETNIDTYTMNTVKNKMSSIINSSNSSQEQILAATTVIQSMPEIQQHTDLIEPINVQKPDDANLSTKSIEAEDIKLAFKRALNNYNLDGWSVVIDDDFTAINVGQEKKEIRIPTDRKLTQLQLEGLIAHEIGTHARRRQNGERSQLKLLGLGLDRYKDDEGVATFEEQQITGATDYAGFIGYFATSLASNSQNSFRNVFDIIKNYHLAHGKNEQTAKNLSWNRCMRTFRGTTCSTPGTCFTKDIVYRDNNIGIWHLVNEKSDEQRRFMVGKYDPTNSRHIWILDQLNITENDLEQLKE